MKTVRAREGVRVGTSIFRPLKSLETRVGSGAEPGCYPVRTFGYGVRLALSPPLL